MVAIAPGPNMSGIASGTKAILASGSTRPTTALSPVEGENSSNPIFIRMIPADDADHAERNAEQPQQERTKDEEEEAENQRIEAGFRRHGPVSSLNRAGEQLQIDRKNLKRVDDR